MSFCHRRNTNFFTDKYNLMRNLLSTFLLMSVASVVSSQSSSDYSIIRQHCIHYSCSEPDIDSVNQTLHCLLAIDTATISGGLADYDYDLGMVYYVKSEMYGQAEFYTQAVARFKKCIAADRKRSDAYYNLSLIAHLHQQHQTAKMYLALYEKYTRKKYWDREFIATVERENP